MLELLVAFFTSFAITLLIIRFKHLYEKNSIDWDVSGPQKFHKEPVPRIGGIGIAVSVTIAILIKTLDLSTNYQGLILVICAAPAFAIGLKEDLTKRVSVKQRLLFTAISAVAFIYLMEMQVTSLGVPFLNLIFMIPIFGIAFTTFAITGLANAYNIIDGFHGLSSMVGLITLLALTYVAYCLGDETIIFLSLVMAGAILGFFIWNYPKGIIFLGDGGAYLIGFWIASLSIWLCAVHPQISPWFALLVNGYPIMETIFTIYRRKYKRGNSASAPDGIHFHTLIYRRITKTKRTDSTFSANAKTAPYLWILSGISIIPAVLWWHLTPALIGASVLFIILYLWIYSRIVQFKTPSWMHF